MFAVDHSATALLIKRRFPSVSMTPLLISVQAMELAWVALNYLGVEHTTTEATVQSVADIHLAYIPYSHSVVTATAAVCRLVDPRTRSPSARPRPRSCHRILSHLILDIATHAPDIALWPGSPYRQLGLGLYSGAPPAAFVVEFLAACCAGGSIAAAQHCSRSLSSATSQTCRSSSLAFPDRSNCSRAIRCSSLTVVFVQIVNNARPDRPDLVESCNDTSRSDSYVRTAAIRTRAVRLR